MHVHAMTTDGAEQYADDLPTMCALLTEAGAVGALDLVERVHDVDDPYTGVVYTLNVYRQRTDEHGQPYRHKLAHLESTTPVGYLQDMATLRDAGFLHRGDDLYVSKHVYVADQCAEYTPVFGHIRTVNSAGAVVFRGSVLDH